jgi:putative spermidine/putrescine transport system permease protein
VSFPVLRTGITAAFMFAALVSINNVTIALFVAGSRTKTLPLVMFNMTEDAITPDLAAMATILTVSTVAILLALEKTVGVYGVLERRGKA